MAGPIRIALVADATGVARGMADASREIDSGAASASRALDSLTDAARRAGEEVTGGFDMAAEASDTAETRTQGFADVLAGTTDAMSGVSEIAKGNLVDGFIELGGGLADLAGGFTDFLIPVLGQAAQRLGITSAATAASTAATEGQAAATTAAATAQRGLNLAFLGNPIFLVIAAIVALVAVFVIAYQRSETFRRIVNGAFSGVLNAVRNVWNWVKGNWPLLLTILTGPIGLAVRFISQNWATIVSGVKAIPGRIKDAFASAGSWLKSAGSNIVKGIWSGINGMSTWLYNTLIGWARRIIPGPIAKALGIASPSKLMRSMFRWVPRGAALGITDETSGVRRAAAGMAAAAVPFASAGAGSGGAGAAGALRLELPAGSSGAGALIVELLRGELRRGGGLRAVLGT